MKNDLYVSVMGLTVDTDFAHFTLYRDNLPITYRGYFKREEISGIPSTTARWKVDVANFSFSRGIHIPVNTSVSLKGMNALYMKFEGDIDIATNISVMTSANLSKPARWLGGYCNGGNDTKIKIEQ